MLQADQLQGHGPGNGLAPTENAQLAGGILQVKNHRAFANVELLAQA